MQQTTQKYFLRNAIFLREFAILTFIITLHLQVIWNNFISK